MTDMNKEEHNNDIDLTSKYWIAPFTISTIIILPLLWFQMKKNSKIKL